MMQKIINPVKVKGLYEHFKANLWIKDAKIENFEAPNGEDCYNPSIPFTWNGKEYILCRTQQREGMYSMVYFFEKENDVWRVVKNAPSFKMEDPAFAFIHGKLIISGVNVHFGDGVNTFTEWKTDFYVATNFDDIQYLTSGPAHMKDIRLVELPNGKIGIFTRPLGEDAPGDRLAKVGFTVVDEITDINADIITKAPLFNDFFIEEEWGGCNYAEPLKNGLIGVIGHKSYRSEDGLLHYYGTAFALNYETREVTDMKVIISRDCFPYCVPREPRLSDITFTAGVVRNGDGTAVVYTGLSDSAVGSAVIKDPFEEYETIIINNNN